MKINKEKLVQKLRPAIAYALVKNFKYLLLVLIATFLGLFFHGYCLLFAIVLLGFSFWKIMKTVTTSYFLYKEVLIVKSGIIAVRFDFLELFRVKDYRVTRSMVERFLGLMSLTLYTRDISSPTLFLPGIKVSELPDQIRDFVQESRIKNHIFEIN